MFFLLSCISLFCEDWNYAPNVEAEEEKAIVVCIASYNNAAYCEKNLESVFSQKYENYRVIYVSDASTDETATLVLEYIRKHELEDKITFFSNLKNRGAMENYYNMIHLVDDEDIVVIVDGDDFLAHDRVFERINNAYADPNVFVTYGSYICIPDWKIGHPRALTFSCLKEGGYRKMEFYWSHLRTFYAKYFKLIPKEWFLHENGEFLTTACDVAMMIGLMDICREHVYYIPTILYHYNRENVLNDDKKSRSKQRQLKNEINRRILLEPIDP